MIRFTRNQLQILLIDGFLGAMIGAVSVGSLSAGSGMAQDRLGTFFVGASVTAVFLAIPMFIATAALTPALLAVLRQWSHQPASSFYLKSALAGVVFGVAVNPVVGFVFGLATPFLPMPDGTPLTDRLLLLVGAPSYLAIGFFFTGFVFWKQVLIAGLGFGLFNGWWVRRHLAVGSDLRAQS